MAPRLPPPPQPNEPDASNNARLLETVIDRLQQQNTTLMEQNATLMQQNQSAMQSLEASRANSEATQRQLMEILAATRHNSGACQFGRHQVRVLSETEGRKLNGLMLAWSILIFCDAHLHVEGSSQVWEWQEVLFLRGTLDRANLEWQLLRVSQLLHHSDGGASLEDMLEEENLEDANLVGVEVKAEP
ncbi:uncharacterized protein HKW66_Vig0166170 [Vigna angularis]|uniref:Uncharacterized protein n=1 Tax=Phaseolus angularis TaxID=3914 RepID=A0A8T0JNK1_PHAAN|nr:uncharacterized protein HKW66_Vig0166170 [Vigna angularis]